MIDLMEALLVHCLSLWVSLYPFIASLLELMRVWGLEIENKWTLLPTWTANLNFVNSKNREIINYFDC